MKKASAFISRHKSMLMLSLMLVTLAAGSIANQRRLEDGSTVTSLPVMKTEQASSMAVSAYIDERDAAYRREIDALTALVDQDELDSRTREAAAEQLQELISAHTTASAMEEALKDTSLAPCAAVLASGSLTIITGCSKLSEADTALVLTLAEAHTGVAAENVRIMTAK